ncbi:TPA: hypothetical protein HIS71_005335 [Escherichia coli]|nr:hypothetical protein [Escherichia coli]EFG3925652.1 hypothetical protein [Escherichia coli]HAI1039637.1 hypothetical protein [Escherichia coli]HAI1041615.1 hypothetical protein [Escherichia coli]HAI1078892.1 hypothetical protein [Escherichia coli]
MKRRLIIAASLFVFNLSSGFAAENIPFSPQPPEIHAGSWVLMDYLGPTCARTDTLTPSSYCCH